MTTHDISQFLNESPEVLFNGCGYYSSVDFAIDTAEYNGNNNIAVILAWKIICALIENEKYLVEIMFNSADVEMRETFKESLQIISGIIPISQLDYHVIASSREQTLKSFDYERQYRNKIYRLSKWLMRKLDTEVTDESKEIKSELKKYKINIIKDNRKEFS